MAAAPLPPPRASERPTEGVVTVVEDDVIAAIAAHAAVTTDGVVRLEAGVRGLMADLSRVARHRIAGVTPARTTGTTVTVTAEAVSVHLDLAVTVRRQAAATAAAVQRAVVQAVIANTGLPVAAVTVSILDVDMNAQGTRVTWGMSAARDGAEVTSPTAASSTPEAAMASGIPAAVASTSARAAGDSRTEVCDAVLAAVRTVPGLRPASPVLARRPGWVPWDPGTLAIDITDNEVEVRLAATRLPLPPLLDQVAAAIRDATAGTRWASVPHRLIVAALDAEALTAPPGW